MQVDPVILQLRAEVEGYTAKVKAATATVDAALERNIATSDRMGNVIPGNFRRVADGVGAMRSASIGAGQQLQDMAVQFQGGARASTILAQQLPQLAFALSGLEGSSNRTASTVGKFATFLAGPWGAAIGIAALALPALIGAMDSTGNAAERNKARIDAMTTAIQGLAQAGAGASAVQIGAVMTQGALASFEAQKLERERAGVRNQINSPTVFGPRREALKDVERGLTAKINELNAAKAGLDTALAGQRLQAQAQARLNAIGEKPAAATKTRTPRAAATTKTAGQKQDDIYGNTIRSLKQEIELGRLRAQGMLFEADLLQARYEIEARFPGMDRARLDAAIELTRQNVAQNALTEDMAETYGKFLNDAQQNPLKIQPVDQKVIDGLGKVKDQATELDKEFKRIADNGLASLSEGISDAIVRGGDLGDVFSRVADQIIADLIRIAIQEGLSSIFGGGLQQPGSGGGGGLLSAIGSLFGRASGGYVQGGQTYRINEGTSGQPEYFRPTGSGTIIPLGQVNAAAARPSSMAGGTSTIRVELSGDLDARIQSTSAQVAVEVVRQSAPGLIDASANEAFRRNSRPRL